MSEIADTTNDDEAGRGAPPLPLRPIAPIMEILRLAVRRHLRDDRELAGNLEDLGILNPEFLDDPTAPLVADTPGRAVVGNLLARLAAARPSVLGEAGVTGLEALAATISEEESGAEAEPSKRAICLGFTDIAGFTEYTDLHGDEAALELIRRHHQIVEPSVRRHGGRVLKRMGDGLMLRFPSAKAGILACREALALLEHEASEHPEAPIVIRIGLHLGRPLRLRRELVGTDVNLTARLAEQAEGGQLLVTDRVRRAAAYALPFLHFEDHGEIEFRGFKEPIRVFEVMTEAEAAARARPRRRGIRR